MRVLIESSGSLVSYYLIKSIKELGFEAVGSDVSDFNYSKILCDNFLIMPRAEDKFLWRKIKKIMLDNKIDMVIPSFDASLLGWSERVREFAEMNIKVIISDSKTIEICQDKWETYNFFKRIGIKTPNTSLNAEFDLIKPRFGRGGKGISENDYKTTKLNEKMISQQRVIGDEYTVDVFFQKDGSPLYIVPRKRVDVLDGKSTKGIVVKNNNINQQILKISNYIQFLGPVNFQLFETENKELIFIEINPRIAGGMALGFAATENWINLIYKNIIKKEKIFPKKIKYGLKMSRYYNECFF